MIKKDNKFAWASISNGCSTTASRHGFTRWHKTAPPKHQKPSNTKFFLVETWPLWGHSDDERHDVDDIGLKSQETKGRHLKRRSSKNDSRNT